MGEAGGDKAERVREFRPGKRSSKECGFYPEGYGGVEHKQSVLNRGGT